jgi:hypothetical protein
MNLNSKQIIDHLYGPPKTSSDKKLEDFKKKNIPRPEKAPTLVEDSFENINFSAQYQEQLQVLQESRLTEQLPSGEYGIIGQDNKEYIIPTVDEILEKMNKDIEKYRSKIEQGFTKLLIVPFAKKLYDPEDSTSLTEIYKELILDKHQKGELFSTNGQALELDTNEALWVWEDGYGQDDENIIYFPQQFDPENHGGQTKNQILQEDHLGYQILLIEENIDIPAENQGQTKANREQLEANLTPSEYQEKIKTESQYQHEQGLTAEAWLTLAIAHLQKHNQVIDDWQGSGKICYNIATYFPSSAYVSFGRWDRGDRLAALGWSVVSARASFCGFRSSVNI